MMLSFNALRPSLPVKALVLIQSISRLTKCTTEALIQRFDARQKLNKHRKLYTHLCLYHVPESYRSSKKHCSKAVRAFERS